MMLLNKYKKLDKGIEIALPEMSYEERQVFFDWCGDNHIAIRLKQKSGVFTYDTGFLTEEEMSISGWDDNLSESTKVFIAKVTPKKLSGIGYYAIVENEENAMAVVLRWT